MSVSSRLQSARQVARDYWGQAGSDERAHLENEYRSTGVNRRLPQRTDGWMLRLATEGLGRWLTESEKWRSRAEFWNEVEVILSEGDS